MKLLLVTFIVVAAIALTISETEAKPQPGLQRFSSRGAERKASSSHGAERKASSSHGAERKASSSHGAKRKEGKVSSSDTLGPILTKRLVIPL